MLPKQALALAGSQSPHLFSVMLEMSLSIAHVCPVAGDIFLGAPVPHSLASAEFVLLPPPLGPSTKFLFPV